MRANELKCAQMSSNEYALAAVKSPNPRKTQGSPPPWIKPSPQSNPKTLAKHRATPWIKPSPRSNPKTLIKHRGCPAPSPQSIEKTSACARKMLSPPHSQIEKNLVKHEAFFRARRGDPNPPLQGWGFSHF